MLVIAIFTGVMTIFTFGCLIGILAEKPPYPKTGLAFATIGFVLLGGIFVASALNTEVPCDNGSQRVTQGDIEVCIPNHEVLDYLETNK